MTSPPADRTVRDDEVTRDGKITRDVVLAKPDGQDMGLVAAEAGSRECARSGRGRS